MRGPCDSPVGLRFWAPSYSQCPLFAHLKTPPYRSCHRPRTSLLNASPRYPIFSFLLMTGGFPQEVAAYPPPFASFCLRFIDGVFSTQCRCSPLEISVLGSPFFYIVARLPPFARWRIRRPPLSIISLGFTISFPQDLRTPVVSDTGWSLMWKVTRSSSPSLY